jgi:hypothetical protein
MYHQWRPYLPRSSLKTSPAGCHRIEPWVEDLDLPVRSRDRTSAENSLRENITISRALACSWPASGLVTVDAVGVDTHLYLFEHELYQRKIVPALDGLLAHGDTSLCRSMFEQAWGVLTAAHGARQYPWTPLHAACPEEFEEGTRMIDGVFPKEYRGARGSTWGHLGEGECVVREPRLAREYHLRDSVCCPIVEGLCVPWHLSFPPVHIVTWCLGHDLYRHSGRFEDVLCCEIYTRSSPIPFDLANSGDGVLDQDLVRELASEIDRVVTPGSKPWDHEAYQNLRQLLVMAANQPKLRVLAVYV